MKEMLFQVGVITAPHGVTGEVRVFPTAEDKNQFKKWETVLTEPFYQRGMSAVSDAAPETTEYEGKHYWKLHITGVKFVKNMVILKFREINSTNSAQLYRNRPIYITRQQAAPCGENENFIADLIDMEVFCEDGSRLGVCEDVLQTGANDVYIVQTEDGKELLLPAIPSCVLKVEVDKNRMTVRVPEGL